MSACASMLAAAVITPVKREAKKVLLVLVPRADWLSAVVRLIAAPGVLHQDDKFCTCTVPKQAVAPGGKEIELPIVRLLTNALLRFEYPVTWKSPLTTSS